MRGTLTRGALRDPGLCCCAPAGRRPADNHNSHVRADAPAKEQIPSPARQACLIGKLENGTTVCLLRRLAAARLLPRPRRPLGAAARLLLKLLNLLRRLRLGQVLRRRLAGL